MRAREGVDAKELAAEILRSRYFCLSLAKRLRWSRRRCSRTMSRRGKLPPVEKRLPQNPRVMPLEQGKTQGQPWRHAAVARRAQPRHARCSRSTATRGWSSTRPTSRSFPTSSSRSKSIEGRSFTFKLRKGHRWSDGHPFTTEDFRYYWEDVANNKELSPSGPPRDLLVDGEPPRVEIINETTVRYTVAKPNPSFLPRLAGTSPLFIFRPAHYLKQFHKKYSAKVAKADADGTAKRKWSAVHNRVDNMYESDNPDLPSLQPWVNTTKPPADRFVAVRNPYFHRVDQSGRQLPYVDRFVLAIADSKLIAAKTGAGEADLQARDLQLQQLHLPQAEREEQQLPHAALARRARARTSRCSRT